MSRPEARDRSRASRGEPIDGATLEALVRSTGLDVRHLVPGYRRLRGGGDAVFAFTLEARPDRSTEETIECQAYLRRFGRPGRQAEVEAKWATLKPRPTVLGSGFRPLPDGGGILFLFPNDLRLRSLFQVTDRKKLKRLITAMPGFADHGWRVSGKGSSIETVRYKPEHRYVARLELGLARDGEPVTERRTVYLRQFDDRRGSRIEAIARCLHGELGEHRVPAPIGTLLDGTTYLEAGVGGVPWIECPDPPAADLGERLAALHAVRVRPFGVSRSDSARARGDALLETLVNEGVLTRDDAEDLARRLRCVEPTDFAPTLVHGDLHLHQVIVGNEGPVLVDLERCVLDDPLRDVGGLLAHARAVGDEGRPGFDADRFRDDFVRAYCSRTPSRRDTDLLFHEALAHLERAILPVRRGVPEARRRSREHVEQAAASLDAAMRAGRLPASHDRASASSPALTTIEQDGYRLERAYPRRKGPWPCVLKHQEDGHAYGTLDPSTRDIVPVRPEEDPLLATSLDLLDGGELIAYRPGQRAVIRTTCPEGTAYSKILPVKKARAVASRLAILSPRPEPPFPEIPTVRADESRPGIVTIEALEGETLRERLAAVQNEDAADASIVGRVARSLVAFQEHMPAEADGVLQEGFDAPLDDLLYWDGIVREHDTLESVAQAAVTIRVAGALREVPFANHRPVLVHGDLHDGNVLLGPDGVGYLDLDGLALGHAAFDPANLAAHLCLHALENGLSGEEGARDADGLLDAYEASGGRASRAALEAYLALCLARTACVHRFRRRTRPLVPELLREAARRLERLR